MAAAYIARFRGLRRWFLLLLLSLLVALPGCGENRNRRNIDYETEEKQKEERLSSLRDQGATIAQKNYPLFGMGYAVKLSGAQITDDTFQKLKELQRVTELDLSKSSITDGQMDQLNEVASTLIMLDLSKTAVTDVGLEKLTNLIICLNLNLAGTKVTPARVEQFKKERLAHRPASVKGKMKEAMNIRLR
jgi:hypothetical protein